MHVDGAIWRPEISSEEARSVLAPRDEPYWKLLKYGRHVGIHKRPHASFWVARIRTKSGNYRQRRLGSAEPGGLTFEEAVVAANNWYESSTARSVAAAARPLGVCRELVVCPIGEVFTIAHAMDDYVEWKRIAAAKSHFETNLSLINFHIIPRLANVPVREFNGEVLRRFARDVLETPPKRGNQDPGERRAIGSIDEAALQKRKKTVNTLIGILRVALQMAWENGKFENDRAWRCLRRLPAVDRPRTLHLSRDECRRLLDHCRPDLARLVLGALYTGCRSTELMRMRCSQVGRDGYGVYVAPIKTYRPRFVFLPDEAMHWFLKLISGRSANDLVFVRDTGKPWFGNQKHLFKQAVRDAGLPDDFTFRGLRHTYASQLIQAGATIFAVAEQLGHSDPTTVLRTYGHLSPQIRESEVRQRFTTVVPEHDNAAIHARAELSEWRRRLHGSDWRGYAQIADLSAKYVDEAGNTVSLPGGRGE